MKTTLTKLLAALAVTTLTACAVAAPQETESNFIDTLVAKKLKQLKLPASPRYSDSEFIRRASLLWTPAAFCRPGEARETGGRIAGARGVRGLLDLQVVRLAARLVAQVERKG